MSSEYFKQLESFSLIGLNAKNTGATLIGTTENGTQKFHPVFTLMVCNSGTLITVVPTVSVGTNGATYNNLIAATSMAAMTAAGNMAQPALTATYGNIAANTGIFINVTIGATATTCLVDIHVFGFYH